MFLEHMRTDEIALADAPKITCQCLRVPVLNGHTAAVFINFEKKPTKEQLIEKLVKLQRISAGGRTSKCTKAVCPATWKRITVHR